MSELLCNDGVIEATLYPEGWLYLRWMQNKHGRLQKRLVMDLMCLEDYILANGLKGWFTRSEKVHYDFHKLLKRVGAREWLWEEPDYIQFNKWVLKPEDLYRPKKEKPHVRLSA